MIRRPPRSTRTYTLFPYTTLFRSINSFTLSYLNNTTKSITIDGNRRSTDIPSSNITYTGNDHDFFLGAVKTSFESPQLPSYVQSKNINSEIAEFILLKGSNIDNEAQRRIIESYLAIKYGISLDSSFLAYKSSEDKTVYDISSYVTNIIGLAKDDETTLDQRISKSVNDGSILTISTDNDFLSINSSHRDILENNDYILMGSNNASADINSTFELDTNIYKNRMLRQWKVTDNLSSQASIYLKFENLTAKASSEEYVLLWDSDGDFSSGSKVLAHSEDGVFNANFRFSNVGESGYITVATINAGMLKSNTIWLKADSLNQANNSDVTSWNTSGLTSLEAVFESGNGSVAPSFNNDASNLINFMPSVRFDDDEVLKIKNGILGSGEYSDIYIYLVQRRNSLASNFIFYELGESTTSRLSASLPWNNGNLYWDLAGKRLTADSSLSINDVNLFSLAYSNQSSDEYFINVDGETLASNTNLGTNKVLGYNNDFTIGESKAISPTVSADANVAEILIFKGNIKKDTNHRNIIESYLSMKYGITLKANSSSFVKYYDSDNREVYSDESNVYHIISLGKDSGSTLDKRISKSQSAGSILTISTDNNFVNENSSHADIFADKEFIFLASNNSSVDFINTNVDLSTYPARMNRYWKIEENTNNDESYNLKFDLAPLVGREYVLLYSSNNDFSSAVTELGSSSNAEFLNIDLNSGYISLAIKNSAPSDIKINSLNSISINENLSSGVKIADLSSSDIDLNETSTYSFVSGVGANDNSSFTIEADTLKLNTNINYEVKDTYSIRIKVTDRRAASFEKAFTISVNDVNETPSDISLSASSIDENNSANSLVANISNTDVDTAGVYTYSLVAGIGSEDNSSFTIDADSLKINLSTNKEVKDSYSIRIKVSDTNLGNTVSYEKAFTISVNDVNETPSDISLSANSIDEHNSANSLVANISNTDVDSAEIGRAHV